MDCGYQDRLDLEDDLYQEDKDDPEESEVDSELEFHLYGQLHYSSHLEEPEEPDDGEEECREKHQPEATQTTEDTNEERKDLDESKCPSPANSQLQHHLKEKKKKREKVENKRKNNPKGQTSSSPYFEKVIVIDSSPEVISISENSAEESEGICSLKGRNAHKQQTSTPTQQDSLKKQNSCRAPVIVDSSTSEFESQESESECESEADLSDSSDSDSLENWMILGRGNQDGDQSITLNVSGRPDGDTDENTEDGSWLVSEKDKEAQIYNRGHGPRAAVLRWSNRYYTDKNMHCRNCDKTGHLSKNCPEPNKVLTCLLCGTPGHRAVECPKKHCNNCGLPGHLFSSCSERAYWHKQCHRCNKTGHFFDACPEIWRQYHITTKAGPPAEPQGTFNGRTPAYCYNCSKKGHFGHACTQQRMFNGVYPNTPFINAYDTVKEIHSRQRRIQLKVKDLKESGLFSALPCTPLTPGPPRKKQKPNNHRNSHTPRQTSNKRKPSTGHIFFESDNDDAVTSKKFKPKRQNVSSTAKPWKPKRPVPTSKNPVPSKLIVDEADDFPRGGGKAASSQEKRKRRSNSHALPKGCKKSRPVDPATSGEHKKHWPKSKVQKNNDNQRWRHGADKASRRQRPNEYPTDENLFAIKQRKRKR